MLTKTLVTKKVLLNETYTYLEIRIPRGQSSKILEVTFGPKDIQKLYPIEWNAFREIASFIMPTSTLPEEVDVGHECKVKPLDWSRPLMPTIMIGDETSLGLSRLFQDSHTYLFVTNLENTKEVSWNYSLNAKIFSDQKSSFKSIVNELPSQSSLLISGKPSLKESIFAELGKNRAQSINFSETISSIILT